MLSAIKENGKIKFSKLIAIAGLLIPALLLATPVVLFTKKNTTKKGQKQPVRQTDKDRRDNADNT